MFEGSRILSIFALTILLATFRLYAADDAGFDGCTPRPDLFREWAASAAGNEATYKDIVSYAETHRAAVEEKIDVFSRLFCKSDAELRAMHEVVLWRTASFLIVIDIRNKAKALVVPRQDTTFPIDLSPSALQKLADVAAATADAAMWASGGACDPKFSTIKINPPLSLGVSQLHIHVPLRLSESARGDLPAYHGKMQGYLERVLGSGSAPDCPTE